MLPFIGYNMSEYFQHWLDLGAIARRARGATLPKIFCVNWFRKGADGKFVWPGYGENMRVLRWIVERVEGTAAGELNAFGLTPRYDDLDWSGLDFDRGPLRARQQRRPRRLGRRARPARRAVPPARAPPAGRAARRCAGASPRGSPVDDRRAAPAMSQPESAPPSRGAIAAADHDLSDAEFAELDELLADIPEPLEPLDVVMLDGFLCGVHRPAELLDADAWLPFVFDAGGHRWGEAEPSPEQRRARALILRRHAALNRAIAEFGSFDPFILEVDDEGDLAAGDEADDDAGGRRAAPSRAKATPIPRRRSIRSARPSCPGSPASSRRSSLLPGLAELDEPAVATTLARLFRFLPDDEQGTAALVARERPLDFARRRDRRGRRLRRRALRADAAAALQGRGGAPRDAEGRPQRPVPVRQRAQVQAVPRRCRVVLMRLQLLSDLHLETESYDPEPAPGAELLVLAGDIDARWDALARFRGWPQPVVFVAGNHEFDGRDVDARPAGAARRAAPASASRCSSASASSSADADGARIRIVGTTRWSDFDLFGAVGRAKAMRAGGYFMDLMQATQRRRGRSTSRRCAPRRSPAAPGSRPS